MKFNYKKITAVCASALMTLSMAGVATAADYPTPFIQDGDANAAIVYGADALDSDQVAASNIQEDLSDILDDMESSDDEVTAELGDESFLISATGNDLTYGEALNTVKDSLDDGELETLLAEGTLVDDSIDYDEEEEIDYYQDIYLSDDEVTFGALDDEDYVVNTDAASDEEPIIYLNQDTDKAYDLTVDFSTSINATAYDDGEFITIAGKDLAFDPDMTSDDDELVLYESTDTVVIKAGESMDVGEDTIEVIGANTDQETATLTINGELYQVSEGDKEGDYYINDVFMQNVPEKGASIEIFTGAKEWKIEEDSNVEVEIDGEEIEGVEATLTGTLTELESIKFTVTPSDMEADEKGFLEVGETFADPLFDFNMVFDSVEEELKADSKGKIEVTSDDEVVIDFTSRNGKEYSIAPYQINETGTARAVLGDDWFSLNTSETYTNLEKDHIFIAYEGTADTDSEETLVYQVSKVKHEDPADGTSYVEFEDLSDGSTIKVYEENELQDTELYVEDVEAAENFHLQDGVGGSDVSVHNVLVTENNMEMTLDLNETAGNSSVSFAEDHGTVFSLDSSVTAGSFVLNITVDATDGDFLTLNPVSHSIFETVTNSDTDLEYGISELGTYYEADDDDKKSIEMWTPSEENTVYNVYFSSEAEEEESSDVLGNILVKDTEVDTVSDKNLIIVGGSCVNEAAAALLGDSYCGEAWENETGVGSGEYMIEAYNNSDLTDGVALLVAGYNAGDTSDGVDYLLSNDVDTSEVEGIGTGSNFNA